MDIEQIANGEVGSSVRAKLNKLIDRSQGDAAIEDVLITDGSIDVSTLKRNASDVITKTDVDDTPVDGVTDAPISSNWAFDHAASETAHGISVYGATLVDDADAATARSTLGLGTVATTSISDYATAAQGAKADSAVQPNDLPLRPEEAFVLSF